MKTAVIVLAAGNSSRLGRSKQLLTIRGTTLITHAVETALNVTDAKVVVVLGSNEAEHRLLIEHLPIHIVSNPDWTKGMGNSLKFGLQYAMKHLDAERVLFIVCDQPLLTSQHLTHLLENQKKTNKDIVASSYRGTIGIPVLFTKKYFSDLLRIEDNQGAKRIIDTNLSDVEALPFPDGEIDIDTIEDYQTLIKRLNKE